MGLKLTGNPDRLPGHRRTGRARGAGPRGRAWPPPTQPALPPAPARAALPRTTTAPPDGRALRPTLNRLLGWVGRGLVGAGVLCLLFAAFELWGTDVLQARAQNELRADFETRVTNAAAGSGSAEPAARPVAASADPIEPRGTTGPSSTTVTSPARLPGDAVALLDIPAIGAEHAVVEGVGVPELRRGPGHYPSTPLPGRHGNAAIAGHRTTYGAPFLRLDDLEAGDRIEVATTEGRFTYIVSERRIVEPSDVSVLAPSDDPVLTLTTCHPRYSARQRLVVHAHLQGQPVDAPETTPPAVSDELDAASRSSEAPSPAGAARVESPVLAAPSSLDAAGAASGLSIDVAVAAVLPVTIGVAWGLIHRVRRRWWTAVFGAAVFLPTLVPFFMAVEHAVPANV